MRVLICGGRDFGNINDTVRDLQTHKKRNEQFKFQMLWLSVRFPIRDNLFIIHGGAKGADSNAGLWAHKEHIPCFEYKADWETYGRSARSIRNQQMFDEGKPDLVIAFPGGCGTADMIRRAKKVGISVEEVKYP